MKKVVKGLVIAASVAAVAGLGAVSFAKWDASTYKTSVDGTGTTGQIALIGFKSNDAITLSGKLVPYNQGELGGISEAVDYISVKLPSFDVSKGYDLTVTLVSEGSTIADEKIMVKYGDQVSATVTNTSGYDALTKGTAKNIENVATESVQLNGNVSTTIEGKYLTIILDSDSSADMNKTFKLQVTVTEKSA